MSGKEHFVGVLGAEADASTAMCTAPFSKVLMQFVSTTRPPGIRTNEREREREREKIFVNADVLEG